MGQPINVGPDEPPKSEPTKAQMWAILLVFAMVVFSASAFYIHAQNSKPQLPNRQPQGIFTPPPPGYDLVDRDGTIIADTHIRVIVPGGLALGASVIPGTRAHCIAINERQGAKVRLESGPEKGDEGYIDLADFRPDSPP